jgi:anti-sigma factor RsiW
MNEPRPNGDIALDQELIAYLDGELDADATSRLEERLSSDAEFRRRLGQHQRAWDLLDELPRPAVDEQFTQTTVEMIALSAAENVDRKERHGSLYQKLTWGLGGGLALVAAIIGYAFTSHLNSGPNRQLVNDLLVLENLDAYRHAEDIEFLRALEREGLFSAEVEDGL